LAQPSKARQDGHLRWGFASVGGQEGGGEEVDVNNVHIRRSAKAVTKFLHQQSMGIWCP